MVPLHELHGEAMNTHKIAKQNGRGKREKRASKRAQRRGQRHRAQKTFSSEHNQTQGGRGRRQTGAEEPTAEPIGGAVSEGGSQWHQTRSQKPNQTNPQHPPTFRSGANGVTETRREAARAGKQGRGSVEEDKSSKQIHRSGVLRKYLIPVLPREGFL